MYSFSEETVIEGDITAIWQAATERMWSARAGIPLGSLRGVSRYEPLDDGRVLVSKVFEVHGPFAPVFRMIWEKGVRADMRLTFAALAAEARRREQSRA